MADGQARGTAREAAIGQQRAHLAQTFGLDVRGGIEHFLHAGASLGAFVAHDHHIARLDLVIEDVLHRIILRLDHMGWAFEHENGFVHACRLDHAAIARDVASQHGEAAFLAEGVLVGADATVGTVQVQAGPAAVLAEGHLGGNAPRPGAVEQAHRLVLRANDVPLGQGIAQRGRVHSGHIGVQLARTLQFAQDGHDAARAVHIFNVVLVGVGCHLAQLRHGARQAVDVGHAEGNFSLLRNGQQVQDGVRGTAHGDVQRDGVFKRLEPHRARQDALVPLLVVLACQLHDAPARTLEELLAVRMGGQGGAVAWQGQAQRLGQTVHGVGSEHAGARAAGRAGAALHLGHVGIAGLVVGGHHHGVDQVQLLELQRGLTGHRQLGLAGFHGATRDKDDRNVQPHRRHQHAGGDLVAVGDAHHGVCTVGVDHVLDRVGNDLAAGQRIQHAVVAHGDAVVHGDGVELLGHATGRLDLARHELPQVLEVHMPRHKLRERVDHRNDGLLEVCILHAGGTPQRAGARHVATGGGSFGTVFGHRSSVVGEIQNENAAMRRAIIGVCNNT